MTIKSRLRSEQLTLLSGYPAIRLTSSRPAPPRHDVRGARAPVHPQLTAADRRRLLVAQSLHRLRVRVHVLLRALRASVRGRAGAGRRQAQRGRVPRLSWPPWLGGVRAADLREGAAAGSAGGGSWTVHTDGPSA